MIEGTRSVLGDAANFDPSAALPEVAKFAGLGARLIWMEANLVRSDGTLDLKASPSLPMMIRQTPDPYSDSVGHDWQTDDKDKADDSRS